MNIKSKSGRSILKNRREPYWARLEAGLFVGYRKHKEGSGTWIARQRQEDSRQKYQALGAFETYDQAANSAKEWADRLAQGVVKFDTTIEDACRAYVKHIGQVKGQKTATDAEGRFKRLVYGTSFALIRLDRLKPTYTREWLNNQLPVAEDAETLRKAKASANRNLAILKASLNMALHDQHVSSDSGWKTVKKFPGVSKRREYLLTKKQRTTLLEKARPDLAALIRSMLYTLSRPGELASAKVSSFNPASGTLHLDGKTGPRIIPLSRDARDFFKQQVKSKTPAAPLLARFDGAFWTKEAWRDCFREAAKAANLPDEVVLYSIRHAAITEAIIGGVDTLTTAKVSGTSLTMIEQHYGHLDQKTALAKLNELDIV